MVSFTSLLYPYLFREPADYLKNQPSTPIVECLSRFLCYNLMVYSYFLELTHSFKPKHFLDSVDNLRYI